MKRALYWPGELWRSGLKARSRFVIFTTVRASFRVWPKRTKSEKWRFHFFVMRLIWEILLNWKVRFLFQSEVRKLCWQKSGQCSRSLCVRFLTNGKDCRTKRKDFVYDILIF